jgi:hypothetical protein
MDKLALVFYLQTSRELPGSALAVDPGRDARRRSPPLGEDKAVEALPLVPIFPLSRAPLS